MRRHVQYPEHEKLAKIRDKSQAIGEFIDWLDEQGLHLGRYDDGGYPYMVPLPWNIQSRLAEFFGINLDVLEDEKRSMLDEQRRLNEERS